MAELRLEVLLKAERSGESVTEVCRRFGISRETYYRYRRRYLAGGLEALEDQSRRPKTSPGQIEAELEAEICGLRKAHPRWGARRIHAELMRAGREPPAVSTIHQALRRNHLVADQPPRRPRALKRFEREVSNDLWQIDATEVRLVDEAKACVLDIIDDHSRYLLAANAAEAATGEAAWDCFEEAASRYGLPRQVLSDNGLCFTGRLHGVEVEFERSLAELGVEPITSAPYHPQTLGKLERFHKTLKEWLIDEGPVTPRTARTVERPVTVLEPTPPRPRTCIGWVMRTVTVTRVPSTVTSPVCPVAARWARAAATAAAGSTVGAPRGAQRAFFEGLGAGAGGSIRVSDRHVIA